MTPEITTVTAIIAAVCGVTALVLSFINTWHQLRRDQVRLKVTPQHIIPVGALRDAHVNFGIDVINLSEFPVVIVDVGFQLTGGRHGTLSTVGCIEPNGRLPQRLDPHTSYSACFWLDANTVELAAVKCAYAQTQCGTEVRGNSPALRQLMKGAARRDQ
jgi:hypothetical protein